MAETRYRNIDLPEILSDDTYGIEGKYLITIKTDGTNKLLTEEGELSAAGKVAERYWKQIPKHFNSIELHEYFIEENAFTGIIAIDISGRTVGEKMIYYNVVSQFEIAFGMMVAKKNPFLLEGSIFHVISWFKAASLVEILKFDNSSFRWKSGYFDFCIHDSSKHKELVKLFSRK